jgi:hypothetical protein
MTSEPLTCICGAVNGRSVILARKDAHSPWVQLESCGTNEDAEEYIENYGLNEDAKKRAEMIDGMAGKEWGSDAPNPHSVRLPPGYAP